MEAAKSARQQSYIEFILRMRLAAAQASRTVITTLRIWVGIAVYRITFRLMANANNAACMGARIFSPNTSISPFPVTGFR
jgi:hypothetical protein